MCWPTILHQGLDLVSQWQSAELSHGEHITGTNRLHTDIQKNVVNEACLEMSSCLNLRSLARSVRKTYTFSSASGGISIARYSLQKEKYVRERGEHLQSDQKILVRLLCNFMLHLAV